nr:hypothetical protein [Tanacetum cinerariifolium]
KQLLGGESGQVCYMYSFGRRTYAERQAANKRKFEDISRNNQGRQQPPKRQDVELALLCVRTCPKESDRVERYIGGLPDSIHGSVAASKPKTMQEATKMATGLMDKKICTYAERQAANKRKFEDTS